MWYTTANLSRTSALLFVTGAAVGITAYIIYRLRKLSEEEENVNTESDQAQGSDEDERRIVVLGLDGAGKTSLLSFMSKQEIVHQPTPTDGFNVMCIQNENKAINIWEVGGSENIRAYWKNFIQDTNILVFVVDSADRSRVEEAGNALKSILREEKLASVPVLVIANKQDVPQALSKDIIIKKMGLNEIPENHCLSVLETQVPPNGDIKGVEDVKLQLLSISSRTG
ncbi:ADP-ribosylation factor-like protein 3 [Liolophura sinensis]|uniref:ADP-ribosylation factor-like protein 3 n=1 Tax=Liolophura sinensis TaxID=3198878 RepID=UPI003158636F